jgi:hypothetical protein
VTANQSLALVSQEHLGSAMRAGSVLVLLALVLVTVFVLPKHRQSTKN